MSAPRWQHIGATSGLLNIKTLGINGDIFGTGNEYTVQPTTACSSSYRQTTNFTCVNPDYTIYAVRQLGYYISPGQQNSILPDTGTLNVDTMTTTSFQKTYNEDHTYYCDIDATWKQAPTGVNGLVETNKTSIYPNPASSKIDVVLANNYKNAEYVQVMLYSIYGQAVANLYSGNAGGLTAQRSLSLPDVANGLYIIQVMANGENIYKEKLSIQR